MTRSGRRPNKTVGNVVTRLYLARVASVRDDHRMHLVTALGMIGVVMLAIGAILLFFRGSSSQDLGTVSHQWVVRTDVVAKAVGRRIRQLRKEKGWSQEHLADEAEVHRTYMWGIEQGATQSLVTTSDAHCRCPRRAAGHPASRG